MRLKNLLQSIVFLTFALLFAVSASAQGTLTVTDVDTKEAPKVQVYFKLVQLNGEPIKGLLAESCSLEVDRKTPVYENFELKPMRSGDHAVAVSFVFPNGKGYREEEFPVRANIENVFLKNPRAEDFFNVVGYSLSSRILTWASGKNIGKLISNLANLETTQVTNPNIFTGLKDAIGQLRNREGVFQKYIILITDGEGEGLTDSQTKAKTRQFLEQARAFKITPIIIGFSEYEGDEIPNVVALKALAGSDEIYFKAYPQSLGDALEKAKDYIYEQYFLDVTIDKDEFWLEEGNYPVKLTIKTDEGSVSADGQMIWPKLKKSLRWLWYTLTGVGLLAVIVIVLILVFRKREPEIVDEGPKDVICPSCQKVVPPALCQFRNEFCLSGGKPDCPYYQMPDQGKITITKGVYADTTFFIKQEITTIGANVDNHVFLNDKSVSRKHAAIKMDEGKRYEIRDFGSSNGTYINDERTERKFLRDGDIIRFGTVETVFKLK